MQYLEPEIVELTRYIWSSTLGIDAASVPVDTAAAYPTGHTLDGVIAVSGAWQGTVLLQVSDRVADRAARTMFDLGTAPVSLADMQDAVGELTNMTGGNIKALMEGQCFLSLPTVVEGRNYSVRVPGSEAVTRVVFEAEGAPFVVSLLARAG